LVFAFLAGAVAFLFRAEEVRFIFVAAEDRSVPDAEPVLFFAEVVFSFTGFDVAVRCGRSFFIVERVPSKRNPREWSRFSLHICHRVVLLTNVGCANISWGLARVSFRRAACFCPRSTKFDPGLKSSEAFGIIAERPLPALEGFLSLHDQQQKRRPGWSGIRQAWK